MPWNFHSASEPSPRHAFWAVLGLAVLVLTIGAAPADAYDTWSVARDNTNCRACHGDFRGTSYVSANDGVAWNTDLHGGHQTLVNRDCNFCHGATRFPVILTSSTSGTACAECHARFEPGAGGNTVGSGLRQHHDRSGVTVCRTCHADSNPSVFRTAGESELPPFYRTADAAYPLKPRNACDSDNSESIVAPPLGLDNDGDLLYDAADGDCAVTGVSETIGTPGLALIGVTPNPISSRSRTLQVFFALPKAGPATLELFDIQGRAVARRHIPVGAAGRNEAVLEPGRVTIAGVYLLRLTYEGQSLTRKVVMMK